MKDITAKANEGWNSAKTIARNFQEFVNAACLAGVSLYALYSARFHRNIWECLLLFAGVLIILQAFLLLVRFFNKPTNQATYRR